jgi:hypothetical protein
MVEWLVNSAIFDAAQVQQFIRPDNAVPRQLAAAGRRRLGRDTGCQLQHTRSFCLYVQPSAVIRVLIMRVA